MHYFQFNIGEYASHTRHLSPIEDIAYRRLLDLAYMCELPLTKDIRQLSRLINLREYQQEISDVLNEFFYEVAEGWVNNRVIKEIERTGKKSEAAKNSAAIRWEKDRKAKEIQKQCGDDANASNDYANASNEHDLQNIEENKSSEINQDSCEFNANASESNADASEIDATQYPIPNTQYPIKNITPLAMLEAMDIPKSLAKDWLAVRKAKKAAPTQTAFDAIKKHAEANGYTFADAVRLATENGWSGFKVSWLNDSKQASKSSYQQGVTVAASSIFKDEYIAEQTRQTIEVYHEQKSITA